MALKEAYCPRLGRNVKFGRRPSPLQLQRRLRLEDYALERGLPSVPPQIDYTPKASRSLHDILGNDSLGDCVIAGAYHLVGLATGNAGALYVPTLAEVTADYSAVGGYVPGDPSTDNGCNMIDALSYYVRHGFSNGTRPPAYLKLLPTQRELELSVYLFEHVIVGVDLPDAWIEPFPEHDGFRWSVAGPANPDNGHCFIGGGYSPGSLVIDTWGMVGALDWSAAAKYFDGKSGGECYAILTPDLISKAQQKAPNGLNWPALIAAFDELGGNVPAPQPAPVPVPAPPVTPPGLTLAQAQAAVTSGIASRMPQIVTAIELAARDGLSANWPRAQQQALEEDLG